MSIVFYVDAIEITNKLKQAQGQQDAEKIIVNKINKMILEGKNDEAIILYLKKLLAWLENKIAANQFNTERTNYRHAAGFIDILLKMPNRKRWKKIIDEW